MRYSSEHKSKVREKILAASCELYKEHGFQGIGVAKLMKHVGLTHGTFYAHFESKTDLIEQTLKRYFNTPHQSLFARNHSDDNYSMLCKIIDQYLSPPHRDDPVNGCMTAALASDIARMDPDSKLTLQSTVDEWLSAYIGLLLGNKENASIIITSMIGAIQIARIYGDTQRSNDFLEQSRQALKSLARPWLEETENNHDDSKIH